MMKLWNRRVLVTSAAALSFFSPPPCWYPLPRLTRTLMRERAISETFHFAVVKGRLSADTDERYIRVYDYERDEHAELPSPLINEAKHINVEDFLGRGQIWWFNIMSMIWSKNGHISFKSRVNSMCRYCVCGDSSGIPYCTL